MKQTLQQLTLPQLRRRAEEESAGLPALMAAAQRAAQSVLTGEHAQRKSGAGEKFWQFREYDPTDRPQDIDWRQSGKGDRIFVRQKERQTMQTALFWCAGGAGMDYSSTPSSPTKHESAAVLTLALAIMMRHAGEQIGLLDGSSPPGKSDHTLQVIGHSLLKKSDENYPRSKQIPDNAGVVLCGDFLDPPETIDMIVSPLAARAGSGIIIQTLDPAEIDLPFTGRAIFENMGGAERHHIFLVESIKDSYQKRIGEHLREIKNICRKAGWYWILHRTDRPVRETLADVWMMTDHEQFNAVT